MRTMEYDDLLPNEPPAAPYGEAAATRDDRFGKLRSEYREEAETPFGVPRSNERAGWIRVR
jgi:hypothetical protein